MGLVGSVGKGIGVDDLHTVDDRKVLPNGLVDEAVYCDIELSLVDARELWQRELDTLRERH